ncbi:MAG: hypothetical protein ACMG6E_02200, partial [Candidatus Roizmanbacteria bacterium]
EIPMAKCLNKCNTLTSNCGCEFVTAYYESGPFRIEGHDAMCGSVQKEEAVKPDKVFIVKNSSSAPAKKDLEDEVTELKALKEQNEQTIQALRLHNSTLMSELVNEREALRLQLLESQKLKRKLKNIKRMTKLIQSEVSE